MGLKVENLTHQQGNFVLDNINFKVRDDEYFMILGPNGAGKSTLLKNMLGLYTPDSGEIYINKQPASSLPPEKRKVGYIPQDLALFPHLSVRENINYGMKATGVDQSKRNKKCNKICDQLNIKKLLDRSPGGLSGGEKQKVALARALVNKPRALFLDEPFASIDRASRHNLWKTLRRLLKSVEIPVLHITHNLDEAYALGDRFGVLMNGSLQQVGCREDIFSRPATPRLARFLSYTNIFEGTVRKKIDKNKYLVKSDDLQFKINSNRQLTGRITLCIRPQDIKIVKENQPLRKEIKDNVFSGRIISMFFNPERVTVIFRPRNTSGKQDLTLKIPAYIQKRYNLRKENQIRVALWQKKFITWTN